MTGIKPVHAALLCAAILVLGSALSVDEGRIAVGPGPAPVHLPSLCLFKTVTGLDCPFCGLTRSVVSIGHLDLRNAWRYHPAGPLVYLLILYRLIASMILAVRGRRSGPPAARRLQLVRARYALGAVLLAAWIVRLIGS